jgi:uncharacterized protein involved in exopolysaccharide biosynthesis
MSTEVAVDGGRRTLAFTGQPAEITQVLVYWRAVAKRKWLIFGFAASAAIVAALVSLSMTPTYRATATVMIEQNRSKVVAIEEVYSGVNPNREHFETQADILSSRSLASSVVSKFNLTRHPEFDPRQQEPPFWQKLLKRAGFASEARERPISPMHWSIPTSRRTSAPAPA